MSQNNEKSLPESQTDDHIIALDPIDHVRLRPGMYIGGIDAKAMTNVVAAVLFDMVPQIRRQVCTALKVAILGPKTLQIWNNGQPISIAAKDVLEKSFAFIGADDQPDDVRVNHGGMINGLQVANAVSSHFNVQTVSKGVLWEKRSKKGRQLTDLMRVRDAMVEEHWTTSLTFTLDEDIFTADELDADAIESLLFDYAHLFPGLKTSFENHMTHEKNAFYAPDGLAQYLEQENRYKRSLHPAMTLSIRFDSLTWPRAIRRITDTRSVSFELEMGFQFLMRPVPLRRSFVNVYETLSHGTHVEVFLQALRDCLLGHSNILRRGDILRVFEHLTLAVNLWYQPSTFHGRGEPRFLNRDFYQQAYEELSVSLSLFFGEYPETLQALETLALSKRSKKRFYLRTR